MGMPSNLRSIPSQPERTSVRLNSWKEIAAYLDRDPRTVQMWEKNEGLPVHRLAHQTRSSVYALTGEIDAWLKNRSGNLLPEASLPIHEAKAAEPPRRAWIRFPQLVWMAAGMGLLAVAAFAWRWHQRQPAADAKVSIAVLAFETRTSSELLAEGLTEDITTELGSSDKITVIARRAVAGYRARHLSLTEIAAESHAALVLRGRVAEMNGQVEVTVEILDGKRGTHQWGKTFVFQTRDAIASEDHIAELIANAVAEQITGASAPAKAGPTTSSSRAMDAYLSGRYYWNQRSLAGLQKAIAAFRQAIAIDPKFASAYAGLAESYDLMTDRGIMRNEEAFRLAKENARIAITLSPDSARAYNALAFATYRQDWDFQTAESEFKKAIQLNPNDAVAHQWYGEFLGDLRRFDQSIAELRKAGELDPLSPMIGCDLADGYLHAGRYLEAEAELKRVLELYPDFIMAHSYLHAVILMEGNLADAESEARTYQSLTGDDSLLWNDNLYSLIMAGRLEDARRELRNMSHQKKGEFDSYQMARLYFLTGQKEAGYAALEDAFRQHSWWLVTMLVDPGFKSVQKEPQYLAIARRVGLPVKATANERGL
jgi:TolB-like protein/Flp pilus assembly protein TadD